MRYPTPRFLILAFLVLLAGCANTQSKQRAQEVTLYTYSSMIRWGEFDGALGYVDPAHREQHPLSDLERARWQQVQVTGYHVQGTGATPEGDVERIVQIGLINRHTQAERVIVHREVWHWDPEARRWWLTTGLPDLSSPAH